MNLPVVFAIDRAGIVGNDGETHQGAFDISFLRFIPNMILCAPRDNVSLNFALEYAYSANSPCAIRYPRGAFGEMPFEAQPFQTGKAQLLKEGTSNKLFIGYGAGVNRAYQTAQLHDEDIALLDLCFVKPLGTQLLKQLSTKYSQWYVFSDSQKQGGVGSAILEFLNEENIYIQLTSFEYEDIFIQHGDTKDIEEALELLPEQIVKKVI
jgi:1-deoxy-D-xylulose-5-phosphate synthase